MKRLFNKLHELLQQNSYYIMRRPKTYVIDEEEHLENLRQIIKRDFFPSGQPTEQQKVIPMRLNDYMKHFKSEQNQVFTELVRGDVEQWKKKHQWMQKSKQLMIESGKSEKPFSNMICKDPKIKEIDFSYVNQNSLNAVFFNHNGETKSYNDDQHDKMKKIAYENCRIDAHQQEKFRFYEKNYHKNPNLQQIPSTPILSGRYEDKKRNKLSLEEEKYSLKRAPSPEPEKMLIMTWGEVESTPLRISNSIESQYRIPQQSQRDKILDELTSKLTKQKMIKKNKKQDLRLKILSSVRPSQSSYRKVSIARQSSIKREVKQQQTRLDGLLHKKI